MMNRRRMLAALLTLTAAMRVAAEPFRTVKAGTVYFSWYNNTDRAPIVESTTDALTGASLFAPGLVGLLAKSVAEAAGTAVFPIRAANPYPNSYPLCLERVRTEKRDAVRPALTEKTLTDLRQLDECGLIFLGYPNWSYGCPPAVTAYLEKAGWKNKIIAPFCVHGTGGLAESPKELQQLLPECTILPVWHVTREAARSAVVSVAGWAGRTVHEASFR